ncbi:MAG: TVP38/TMEM64 family protein [Hyphomicrobiaceae bacterium]
MTLSPTPVTPEPAPVMTTQERQFEPVTWSVTLKRWLPLILIGAVMTVVFMMGWHRQLTFENLALRRGELGQFVQANLLLALLIFMGLYVAVVALSLPGAGVLTITGGLLFGVWLGAPATIIAATLGAIIIFLIAKTSLGAALAGKAGPWLDRFRDGFEKEGITYMLVLRLVPFPFFIINLVPAVLGVPLRTFAIGTFFGIMPATFAFSYLGDTLDRIITEARAAHDACLAKGNATACKLSIELSQLPIRQILLALTLIGLVSLIPAIVKRWRARDAAI